MVLAEFMETLMIICFSTSWYWSIRQVWISQDSRGMPRLLPAMVAVGCFLGLGGKLALWHETGVLSLVAWIYAWNVILALAQYTLVVKLAEEVEQHRVSGVAPGDFRTAIS